MNFFFARPRSGRFDHSLFLATRLVLEANTLRGLVKIIDDVGDDEIQDIAIPTGIPIIYNFDRDLNPIKPSVEQGAVSQVHMSGVFLEKPGTCLPICLFF